MNRKHRTLMFVLELVQRHSGKFIIKRIFEKIENWSSNLK